MFVGPFLKDISQEHSNTSGFFDTLWRSEGQLTTLHSFNGHTAVIHVFDVWPRVLALGWCGRFFGIISLQPIATQPLEICSWHKMSNHSLPFFKWCMQTLPPKKLRSQKSPYHHHKHVIAVHPLRITNGSLKKEAAGLPASPYPDLGLIERTTVTLHQCCLSLGLMEKERHDMTWQTRCSEPSMLKKTPQQGQELLEARHQLKPEAIAI